MTSEEAIKILYSIRAYYAGLTAGCPAHDCYGLGDMKCSDICKALLRSISLLKQEPIIDKIRLLSQEPKADAWSIKEVADSLKKHGIIREQGSCEDCVSREWLKTAIHNFYHGLKHIPTEEDIQAYIDVAPSVNPHTRTEQRLCRTCIYGDKNEYDKPCIIYSDNCQLYKAKILDKIRAEIFNACSDNYHMPVHKLSCEEIFEIIDRYKAESEVEE